MLCIMGLSLFSFIFNILSQHKVTTFPFPLHLIQLFKSSCEKLDSFFCLGLLFMMCLATGLEMRQLLIYEQKKIKMVDPNTVLLDVVIVKECNIFFCYLIHMLWKIPGADKWFLRSEISPCKWSQWEKYIPLSIICQNHVHLKSTTWEGKIHSWIHSRKTWWLSIIC